MHDSELETWAFDPDRPGSMVNSATGEVISRGEFEQRVAGVAPDSGAQLAPVSAGEIEQLLQARALPVLQWAQALLNKSEYEEDADTDPALEIVAAILGGTTSAEILAATNMKTAEDLIGTEPGGHSPLLEITDARPLKSTFTAGPSCFCVIGATIVATGEQFKFTCGARGVQAAILAHVYRDLMPFQAILVRRLKPTRAGFYPLNLEAGG